MKKIGLPELFAGRKRLKKMGPAAIVAAEALRLDLKAAQAAREMLRFHHGLRSRFLDALIVIRGDDGKWFSFLVLKNAPRGMPNLIGAPGMHEDEAQATEAGRQLLVAAHLMVLDFKAETAAGNLDQMRRFEFGDLAFGVPTEIISLINNRQPRNIGPEEKERIRVAASANLREMMSGISATEEGWALLGDQRQVEIMFEAARLLCVEVNSIAA